MTSMSDHCWMGDWRSGGLGTAGNELTRTNRLSQEPTNLAEGAELIWFSVLPIHDTAATLTLFEHRSFYEKKYIKKRKKINSEWPTRCDRVVNEGNDGPWRAFQWNHFRKLHQRSKPMENLARDDLLEEPNILGTPKSVKSLWKTVDDDCRLIKKYVLNSLCLFAEYWLATKLAICITTFSPTWIISLNCKYRRMFVWRVAAKRIEWKSTVWFWFISIQPKEETRRCEMDAISFAFRQSALRIDTERSLHKAHFRQSSPLRRLSFLVTPKHADFHQRGFFRENCRLTTHWKCRQVLRKFRLWGKTIKRVSRNRLRLARKCVWIRGILPFRPYGICRKEPSVWWNPTAGASN